MHLSRKIPLKMWMESKMENGKFYYVRLSARARASVCECVVYFLFSSRFRNVCDCRYRLKCIQNYHLYFRKYWICVYIPIAIPFYFFFFLNVQMYGWMTHYYYFYRIDVIRIILLIQQLISDSSIHTFDEHTTGRHMIVHRKVKDGEGERKIKWDSTCIFTCDLIVWYQIQS